MNLSPTTALLWSLLLPASGCSVGEGDGELRSERLYVADCWEGAYDLNPNFFAANPFRETMQIRIQHGEQSEEESDGVMLLIRDAVTVREELIGESIRLGLPASVTPPGQPLIVKEAPLATLAVYLHDTCHVQNGALYSVDGWIRFDSLFSGDLNEDSAEKRLTEGEFEATVVDPRDGVLTEVPGGQYTVAYPDTKTSLVSGSFRFYFHRGTPAQPFP